MLILKKLIVMDNSCKDIYQLLLLHKYPQIFQLPRVTPRLRLESRGRLPLVPGPSAELSRRTPDQMSVSELWLPHNTAGPPSSIQVERNHNLSNMKSLSSDSWPNYSRAPWTQVRGTAPADGEGTASHCRRKSPWDGSYCWGHLGKYSPLRRDC